MNLLYSILIILLGASIGTALVISVRCANIHWDKSLNLDFKQSFNFYVNKNPWALVVGVIVVGIFLFVYPSILGSYQKILSGRHPKYESYIKFIVQNLRICSIGLGVASQGLGFLLVGFSDKKLVEYSDKIKS